MMVRRTSAKLFGIIISIQLNSIIRQLVLKQSFNKLLSVIIILHNVKKYLIKFLSIKKIWRGSLVFALTVMIPIGEMLKKSKRV